MLQSTFHEFRGICLVSWLLSDVGYVPAVKQHIPIRKTTLIARFMRILFTSCAPAMSRKRGPRFMTFNVLVGLPLTILTLLGPTGASAQTLPAFRFNQQGGGSGWISQHDISEFTFQPAGLHLAISGSDPFFAGPQANYPAAQPLWMRIRQRSDQGGTCQVFFFKTAPSEAQSVSFAIPAGRWVNSRIALPALGAGYRLRIDPPGIGGSSDIESVLFEPRNPSLPDFDFTSLPDSVSWSSPHDMAAPSPTDEGLLLKITGSDPYLFGPARDYPVGSKLWLNLRIRSVSAGTAQIFHFQAGPTEDKSVRFAVPGGRWADLRIPFPALGAATRLRFDPPGGGGECVIAAMRFELRPEIAMPTFATPPAPILGAGFRRVVSGGLELLHAPSGHGALEVRHEGTRVAIGNTRSPLGYQLGTTTRWLTLTQAVTLSQSLEGGILEVTTLFRDPDQANWTFRQTFAPGSMPGVIDVAVDVRVSQDRQVILLPLFTLLPGAGPGSFGKHKSQALLAGVEYLEDEPSSSESDVMGPGALRRVPERLKLTFPLMALSASNHVLGLMWEAAESIAALHDTPDRIFGSGGHLMGLIHPGSEPTVRADGELLPYAGVLLPAGQPLQLRARILAATGATIVPAVQSYVALAGLPNLPATGYSDVDYFRLAARGWLDSDIREGARFRHAVGASFGSQPAVDAALNQRWLAQQVRDASLSNRLVELSRQAVALVPTNQYNQAAVGHVRSPVQPLLFGGVIENADTARALGTSILGLFQPDGGVLYTVPSTGLDLGRTHFSREANGLAAPNVVQLLQHAVFSGDRTLRDEGLRLLRALDRFANTVPRGAQTWEVPLHTPDILASAHLVRAYTLGYELTGEEAFLEQARYWAWTGVPFIYLNFPFAPETPSNPGPLPLPADPAGAYSTTPVFGATQFIAPLWIGLPVQWCGLVYGDAIRRLALYDPNGAWIRLADGIAAAGIQHMHTAMEPQLQGLLPDSFDLRNQIRNPVPINPATLLPEAARLYGKAPIYDSRSLLHHRLWVHAPGLVEVLSETAGAVRLRVKGWPDGPYSVLVTGFTERPKVRLNGRDVALTAPHVYQTSQGRLVLRLSGETELELVVPAKDALRIERKPNTAMLRVSWSTNAATYRVERGTALGTDGATWTAAEGPVVTQGRENQIDVAPSGQAGWFRLKAASLSPSASRSE